MKKVKTLLVTAVAALSLTSCNYQDAINWAKNAGSQVGGFFTSLLEKFGLKQKEEKKEEACKHEDKNHDGKCDLCGEEGLEVVHVDENHDHKCDVCGEVVSQHADADGDFVCDICGGALAVSDVRLDTSGAVLEFGAGEAFSTKGLKVIATSEAGSEMELEFSASQPDMSTGGEKEVTVNFTVGGEQRSLSYQISVSNWSADDLENLESLSEGNFTFLGDSGLPYMAGSSDLHLVIEFEENSGNEGNEQQGALLLRDGDTSGEGEGEEEVKIVKDWYFKASQFTDAQVERYLASLKAYEAENGDLTYKFEELDLSADGWEGLVDTTVFKIAPLKMGSYGLERAYRSDEYLVAGFNANDEFVLRTKFVNADLESALFLGTTTANGTGYSGYADELLPLLPELLVYYYSELASLYMPVPTATEDNGIYFWNFLAKYAFNEAYDKYDMALEVFVEGLGQASHDELVTALETLEFVKQDGKEGDPYAVYKIESEAIGSIEYVVYDYDSADGGLYFDVYFVAPEEYTTHFDATVASVMSTLGVEKFERDTSAISLYRLLIIEFSQAGEGFADAEAVINSIGRKLLNAEFTVKTAATLSANKTYYSMSFTDGKVNITAYVDTPAGQDGNYSAELYFTDATKYEVPKAEAEMQAFYEAVYDEKGLLGVDYTEKDGEYSFTEVLMESGATDAHLQVAAEYFDEDLADTFVQASSEATSAGWTAIYNDYDRDLQAQFDASVKDGVLSVVVTIREKTFITPESTLVAFLTAKNGTEPVKGTDYNAAANGKFAATFSATGEFTADDLQAEAEKLIATFGEGFSTLSSAAQQNGSWLVKLNNTTTGIRAYIIAALGENGAIDFTVITCTIPLTAQQAADAVGKGFGKTSAYDDSDGSYWWAAAYAAASVSIATAQTVVTNLIPIEFSVASDWATDPDDGSVSAAFINDDNVVLYVSIYSTTISSTAATVIQIVAM